MKFIFEIFFYFSLNQALNIDKNNVVQCSATRYTAKNNVTQYSATRFIYIQQACIYFAPLLFSKSAEH